MSRPATYALDSCRCYCSADKAAAYEEISIPAEKHANAYAEVTNAKDDWLGETARHGRWQETSSLLSTISHEYYQQEVLQDLFHLSKSGGLNAPVHLQETLRSDDPGPAAAKSGSEIMHGACPLKGVRMYDDNHSP